MVTSRRLILIILAAIAITSFGAFGLLDFVLLIAGTVLPLTIVVSVWFSRRRRYYTWAKIISLVVAAAALGWGAIESTILFHRMMRHTLLQLEAGRLALAILTLGCICAVLSPRAYRTMDENADHI
jgi:hypothetical protein